jgi:hypothetical protein
MRGIIFKKARPEVPVFVFPEMRKLIGECLSQKPRKRPSFEDILFAAGRNRIQNCSQGELWKSSLICQSSETTRESHWR